MVKKIYVISFIIVVLDQILKNYFTNHEFFIFRYILNTGAAFNLLRGWNTFLVVFGLIVIGVILYYRNNKKLEIGLGFLLGGTLSNVIDRLFFNGVIDYVHLFNNIFNLADICNIIGALILIYHFSKE